MLDRPNPEGNVYVVRLRTLRGDKLLDARQLVPEMEAELRHGRYQARSEKGGGSSMGPAPPPRKENYATETCTTNENNTSVLEDAGPGLPGRMTCCGERKPQCQ